MTSLSADDTPWGDGSLARYGAAALGTILVFWTGYSSPISLSSRLLLVLVLSLCAVIVLWSTVRGQRRVPLAPVVVAVLVVGALVLAVGASPAARTSAEAAVVLLTAVALFLTAALGPLQQRRLDLTVVIAATAASLFVLWEFLGEVVRWWVTIGEIAPDAGILERLPVTLPRVGPLLTHPNLFAMVGEVALPLVVVGVVFGDGTRRLGWTLAGLTVGAGLVATGSRGGFIGALAAVALTAILAVVAVASEPRRVLKRVGVGSLIAAGMGVGLLALTDIRPDFLFRGTLGARLPVVRAGWEMFLDRPWFGHGPGAFAWQADQYLGSTYPGVEARMIWIHAHNGYVNALAELGVLGSALVLGAALILFVRAWKLRSSAVVGERVRAGAQVGILVGLGLHMLVDVVTWTLIPLVYLAVALGSGMRSSRPAGAAGNQGLAIGSAMAIFLLAIGPVVTSMPAQAAYEKGRSEALAGEWAEAATSFGRAADLDPLPLYRRVQGTALLNAGGIDEGLLRDVLGRGVTSEPRDVAAELNLAKLEGAQLDQLEGTVPADEVALVEYSVLASAAGSATSAADAAASAIRINPWLASAPVWGWIQGGDELQRAVVERLVDTYPCGVGSSFLLQGLSHPDEIRSACPPSSPAGMAAAVRGEDTSTLLRMTDRMVASTPDAPVARRFHGMALIGSDSVEEGRLELARAGLLGDEYAALALAGTFGKLHPPEQVEVLLSANAAGDSPVYYRTASDPLYLLSAFRTELVYQRLHIPSTLARTEWEGAATWLHVEILRRLGVEAPDSFSNPSPPPFPLRSGHEPADP